MPTIAQLEKFLTALKDPTWEPGLLEYHESLAELNKLVLSACENNTAKLEGNFFYPHPHDNPALPSRPDIRTLAKRRNYATFMMTGTSALEVGFNAGHSALLALTINPNLTYSGIDLGHHAYTRPCFKFLKSQFGDRIQLLFGDSRVLLPTFVGRGNEFDIFHIDGGHGFDVAYADLTNMIEICKNGDVILFDDTNFTHLLLDELCDYFAIKGLISRIVTSVLWSGNQHVLLRVNK